MRFLNMPDKGPIHGNLMKTGHRFGPMNSGAELDGQSVKCLYLCSVNVAVCARHRLWQTSFIIIIIIIIINNNNNNNNKFYRKLHAVYITIDGCHYV